MLARAARPFPARSIRHPSIEFPRKAWALALRAFAKELGSTPVPLAVQYAEVGAPGPDHFSILIGHHP
jgi:hypothetical protein